MDSEYLGLYSVLMVALACALALLAVAASIWPSDLSGGSGNRSLTLPRAGSRSWRRELSCSCSSSC